MTKREFAKRLPVFSRLVRTIDALRKQNAELQSVLHQLITVDLAAIVDREGGQSPLAGGIPGPPRCGTWCPGPMTSACFWSWGERAPIG